MCSFEDVLEQERDGSRPPSVGSAGRLDEVDDAEELQAASELEPSLEATICNSCTSRSLFEVHSVPADGDCAWHAVRLAIKMKDERAPPLLRRFESGSQVYLEHVARLLETAICVHDMTSGLSTLIGSKTYSERIAHVMLRDEHFFALRPIRVGIDLPNKTALDFVNTATSQIPRHAREDLKDALDLKSPVGTRCENIAQQIVSYLGIKHYVFFGDEDWKGAFFNATGRHPDAQDTRTVIICYRIGRDTDYDRILRWWEDNEVYINSIPLLVVRLAACEQATPVLKKCLRENYQCFRPYHVQPLSNEFWIAARGRSRRETTLPHLVKTIYGQVNTIRNAYAMRISDCYEHGAKPEVHYFAGTEFESRPAPSFTDVSVPKPLTADESDKFPQKVAEVVNEFVDYLQASITTRTGNIKNHWELYSDMIKSSPESVDRAIRRAPDNLAFVTGPHYAGVPKYITTTKSNTKEHTHFYDGSKFVSISHLRTGVIGIVSDLTNVYIEPSLLHSLRRHVDIDRTKLVVDLADGVPGCGKTTALLEKFKLDTTCCYLTSTRAARDEVRTRIKNQLTRDTGRGLNQDESHNLSRCVRTYASFELNGFDHPVKKLMLDECLMQHPGIILSIIARAQRGLEENEKLEVFAVGDLRQIPFISRVSGFYAKYNSIATIFPVTRHLTISYRCPADVAYAWNDYYPGGFTSARPVDSPTMEKRSINSAGQYPRDREYHYLTFTQNEKSELVGAGLDKLKVNTVHEYQGNQSSHICLVRLRDKDTDEIYNSKEHVLVATTRHTKSFVYASVYGEDLVVKVIKASHECPRARKPCLRGGGPIRSAVVVPVTRGIDRSSVTVPIRYNYSNPVVVPSLRTLSGDEVLRIARTGPSMVQTYGGNGDFGYDNAMRVVVAARRLGFDATLSPAVVRVGRELTQALNSICDINGAIGMIPPARVEVITITTDPVPPPRDHYTLEQKPDPAFLQIHHDAIFPLNSLYDHSHTNYMSAHSDLTFNSEDLKHCALWRLFKPLSYDTAHPVLSTCAPIVRPSIGRESLHSILKRNMAVANSYGYVDEVEVAEKCWQLFENNFIARTQLYQEYSRDPIGIDRESITEWFSRQEIKPDAIIPDRPIHLEALNHFQFAVKTSPKPDLTQSAYLKHPQLQTVVFQSKVVNAIFCPIVREVKKRLLSVLGDNVILYADMSPSDLAQKLNEYESEPILWHSTSELDISKYDKSQALTALEIDCRLFLAFGVEPYLVDLWRRAHQQTEMRDYANRITFKVAYQRKSGDASTLLGNTVFLLCVVSYLVDAANQRSGKNVVDLKNCLTLASGDDSYIYGTSALRDHTDIATMVFNLEVKTLRHASQYFCSKFIIRARGTLPRVYVLPDPVKLLVKLGRTDLRNPAHVEEYRKGLLDLTRDYDADGVAEALDEAILDRYGSPINCPIPGLSRLLRSFITNKDAFDSLYVFDVDGNYIPDIPNRDY
nr:RNA-dependent RNA polymerase [ssRNA positive-strand virus sp.]